MHFDIVVAFIENGQTVISSIKTNTFLTFYTTKSLDIYNIFVMVGKLPMVEVLFNF